jgi:nucleotide-binding universal stress UspA family protein
MEIEDAVNEAIVVGIDGSPDSDGAIRWGADQAALEGLRLVLVHADHDRGMTRSEALEEVDPLPSRHSRGVAQAMRAALPLARHRPGLHVQHLVAATSPRELLGEASRSARLMVLGSRGHGVVRSLGRGSVGASVMRHAECPVVVVRHPSARWTAGVLVGADGTAESRPVVEFAFRLASLRRLPLTVVHTSFPPDLPDGVASVPGDSDGDEFRLLLAESVAGFGEQYPDVRVTRRLERGLSDEGLRRGRHPWDVIVVGRHPRHGFLDAISGTTSTSVLERTRGVVAMVPQPARGSDT